MMSKGKHKYNKTEGGLISETKDWPVSSDQAGLMSSIGLSSATEIADSVSEFSPTANTKGFRQLVIAAFERSSKAKGGNKARVQEQSVDDIVNAVMESPVTRFCAYLNEGDNKETYVQERLVETSTEDVLRSITALMMLEGTEGTPEEIRVIAKQRLAKLKDYDGEETEVEEEEGVFDDDDDDEGGEDD